MLFKVRTFDVASGAITERSLEGEDAAALRLWLEQRGDTVLSVAAPGRRRQGRNVFNSVLFCDELRMLLSSGMSLVEAIETLCTKEGEGYKREVLLEIQRHLLEGKSLSAALAQNSFDFPALLIASAIGRGKRRARRAMTSRMDRTGRDEIRRDR